MDKPTLKRRGTIPLCFRCGSSHYRRDYCRANGQRCYTCHQLDHIKTQCHYFQSENTTTAYTKLKDHLNKTLDKLKYVTSCAVCLDVGSAEKIQCVRGHFICATCKGIQDKCPTCQDEFSTEEPSIVVRQMIETLVNVCRHNNCYSTLKDDHEDYCRFKETDCQFQDCDWKGPANDLVRHVTEKHHEQEIFENSSNMFGEKHDSHKRTEFYALPTLHYFEGHIIWHSSYNASHLNGLLKKFYFIPNGKPNRDITAEITFKSPTREYNYKIKLQLDKDLNMFELPRSSIPEFEDIDGDLVYTLRFSYSQMT